jgi:riboflavin synthase
MFTGIVEGTGEFLSRESGASSSRIWIEAGPISEGVNLGDSVALNGCCLTVTQLKGTKLAFDLLHETELRTNLNQLRPGSRMNLERALAASGRYGGHFVTGHVDDTGIIRRWEQVGSDYELRIGMTLQQGAYLVPKGCIAIDGISLTVAEVGADEFSVWIIPHTRQVTALNQRKPGDKVNLEFDLLAKYVEKILAVKSNASVKN